MTGCCKKGKNRCVHHSRLFLGKWQTDTSHTMLHEKPIEIARGIDICPDNDNAGTNSLDAMIAFRGTEAEGHLSDLLPNN